MASSTPAAPCDACGVISAYFHIENDEGERRMFCPQIQLVSTWGGSHFMVQVSYAAEFNNVERYRYVQLDKNRTAKE